MKREAHKAAVRARILGVARRLFLKNGYEDTTIRRIAELADVRTGSIYHFFSNKEDIFQQIAVEAFLRVARRVESMVGADDHLTRLACELTSHAHVLTSDPTATELYLITYNSPQVARAILEQHLERSRQFFSIREPSLTETEHLARAMMLRSTMQAIALRAESGQLPQLEPLLGDCLRLLFRALDFKEQEIQQALQQVEALKLATRVAEVLENGRMMG